METVDFMDTETHVTNIVSILENQGHPGASLWALILFSPV